MAPRRIYLAGPEVFLANAQAIGEAKIRLCAAQDFEGVFPHDLKLDTEGLSPEQSGLAIYAANRQVMDTCDLVIANMTPFRGPSADVGTVFEMGYMRGRGRPVFAYSNVEKGFFERTKAALGTDLISRPSDGAAADPDGLSIENYDLVDNLMLEGVVREFAERVITHSVPRAERYSDLTAFEACLVLAASRFPSNLSLGQQDR